MLPGGDFSSVIRQLVMAPSYLTLVAWQDVRCHPEMLEGCWGLVGARLCVPQLMLLMAERWDGAPVCLAALV